MRRGALAIQAKLDELAGQSLNEALRTMGMTCMSTIGGSSGPVFGTLHGHARQGAARPADRRRPRPRASTPASQALTRLGKAEVGQKTLLDVLDPVQKVLARGGDDLVERVRQCALDSAAGHRADGRESRAAPRSSATARSAMSTPARARWP